MRPILGLPVLALLLLIAPGRCFGLWEIAEVTPQEAKELGLEVRAIAAGPEQVRIEMEFKSDGVLKGFDRVDLRVEEADHQVTAPLKEERTAAGRVMVSFSADRKQVDKINLWIMIPQPLGGVAYEVRMKTFVDLTKVK
jgi:hypothetical protein